MGTCVSWEWPASSSWEGAAVAAGAGEGLARHLLRLYGPGELTAKDLCLTDYWAGRAGAGGPLAKYGFHPDHGSDGHFQRRLDSFMPAPPSTCCVAAVCHAQHGESGSAYAIFAPARGSDS